MSFLNCLNGYVGKTRSSSVAKWRRVAYNSNRQKDVALLLTELIEFSAAIKLDFRINLINTSNE